MTRERLRTVVSLLLAASACNERIQSSCDTFIGDSQAPIEAAIIWSDPASIVQRELVNGQAIPLGVLPDGGFVIFIAARARNTTQCVDVQVRVTDFDTGAEVLETHLLLKLAEMDADGWGRPAARDGLPYFMLCPTFQEVSKPLHGVPYQLEVVLVDRQKRQKALSTSIVPTCMFAEPGYQRWCECVCGVDFQRTATCFPLPDSGTD